MTLGAAQASAVFLTFAFSYFVSALIRAVTATLAPVFSQELGLTAGDLGLLAGAYFLGFASMQLPLGQALDRFGPRRTLLVLLAFAVLGCLAFSMAPSLGWLIAARVLIGMGVGACLMAPLTLFRRLFTPVAQLRANSWMLMTGSLGMVASTLPVQAVLPFTGWRGLFVLLGGLLAAGMLLIAWRVPKDVEKPRGAADQDRYIDIVRHPLFLACAPLGFIVYGGMIAVQSLWAGPWLTRVAGQDAGQAAQGLFAINLAMLVAFGVWGLLMPRLVRRGIGALRLMAWGIPLAFVALALNLFLGTQATALQWAVWCIACTFVSVSQPAVGAAFPPHQAGRALSAFNLVIFSGVFCVQWGMGLLIDALHGRGWTDLQAFRAAFATLGGAGVIAYAWFLRSRPHGTHNQG